MPIIINIDVVLAKRKMSMSELAGKVWHYSYKFINLKNQQGKSNTIFHSGGYMQGTGLPAGRYFGI